MTIEGDLKTVSVYGILQLLCEEKKTGLVKLFQLMGEEYQIILADGEIVYAIKPTARDSIGALLKREGFINEIQLQEALKISKAKRQSLGKILVDTGIIRQEELSKVLAMQIVDVLCRLLLWKEGRFFYADVRLDLKWLLNVPLNTMKMLMTAARMVDEGLHLLRK